MPSPSAPSRILAYARVSTRDQDPQLQLDALAKFNPDDTYVDRGVSGKLASRPELERLLADLREGDTLLVWKFDRLGRDTRNLLALVDELTARGVAINSITDKVDTSGAMGRAMLTIMSAFAQLERDQLSERTLAGLEVAREAGRLGGRPPKLTPEKVAKARLLMASGDHTMTDIADMLHVSRPTLYRALSAPAA
jgi:DNA invertase Pin-like site-specific DNA recombinase